MIHCDILIMDYGGITAPVRPAEMSRLAVCGEGIALFAWA